MICGSGLLADTDPGMPDNIPNGASVPAYDSVNLGFTQGFKWAGIDNLIARFDVVNVADQIYQIRSGSGVGVFAPQYGQRRSFYVRLQYKF
ncbi:MAG TPA: hypothetical protein VL981_00620 [Candidatus Methylacidiphilales bacterium]|nr:hypothetical protein [Candidatus Methylacidiphilales bacterium]